MGAPYTGMTQLINGNFADAEGNPVALGYIIMQLNQDAQSSLTSQVVGGRTIKITLDASGNAVAGQYVWPNTALNPTTTFYIVNVYTAAGQLVWGPNYMLVNTTPTFDLDGWVPNQVGSGGAPVGSITLQTNEVNNGSQQLLDLHAGSSITLTDNGSGRVTIAGAGSNGPRVRGWHGWSYAGQAGFEPTQGFGAVPTGVGSYASNESQLECTATQIAMLGFGSGSGASQISGLVYTTSGASDDGAFTLGVLGQTEAQIQLGSVVSVRYWIGFMNGMTAHGENFWKSDTPPYPTCAFRFSTAAGDTHWQAVVTDGTTQVTTPTTVAPDATTPHLYAIKFSTPNVLFYIDGVLVATVSIGTTTLTAAQQFNGFHTVDNVGAANNKIVYFSYVYWDTNP